MPRKKESQKNIGWELISILLYIVSIMLIVNSFFGYLFNQETALGILIPAGIITILFVGIGFNLIIKKIIKILKL
jgi:hypothetical protein